MVLMIGGMICQILACTIVKIAALVYAVPSFIPDLVKLEALEMFFVKLTIVG